LAIRQAAADHGMAAVVFAGSVGTIIEWYDFLIYGTIWRSLAATGCTAMLAKIC